MSNFDRFEIKVENHLADTFRGVVDFGSCFPAGAVRQGDAFHLRDRQGAVYPLAWRPLITQGDSTVQWAHFTFPVQLRRLEFRHFTVCPGPVPVKDALLAEQDDGAISIRNGEDEWLFHPEMPLGLASLRHHGIAILDGARAGAEMLFEGAGPYTVRRGFELSLARSDPFQASVEARGEVSSADGDAIFLRLLYTISLGRPGCDLNIYFSNRRRSDQEVCLQRFAVWFGLSAPPIANWVRQSAIDCLCYAHDQKIGPEVRIENGAVVDGSGLIRPEAEEIWPFFQKLNPDRFFRRVGPHLGVQFEAGGIVLGWRRAANLETNSVSVDDRLLAVELVSPRPGGRRVPQGFSRSFEISLSPFSGQIKDDEAFRLATAGDYRPLVSVHPDWYIANRVEELDRYLPYSPDLHPRFEKQAWRSLARGYFGGFYNLGDYTSSRGSAQMLSEAANATWNNNEEDHIKGIGLMLMRTGDPSYMEDLRLCARHLLEVDRCAYSSHPLQNGVLIAHAPHHFDGAGYPSHCWAEGLLLYYKLSGDQDAMDAFLQLCECLLLWTTVPDKMLYADGREMGVSLTNFSHAYRLTGDERFLNAARLYVDEFRRQMCQDGGLLYNKGGYWAPYAEYVAVEGLWDYYELIGGEEIPALLLDIIQWITSYCIQSDGIYDGRSTSESMLHIYYIAYRLSGDECWLEKGRRGMEQALSQGSVHFLLTFNNNGGYYHEAMKRGWFRDDLIPLEPVISGRAVFRTCSEPVFVWEKLGIDYSGR